MKYYPIVRDTMEDAMKAQEATIARERQFKSDVMVAVRQTIAGLDRGTVGIGKDCLFQMAVGKISKSMNGPRGTNGAYYARQVFNEVVSSPAFASFVY